METNIVTMFYPLMVGTFYHYKVILVAIETILCVRYFGQFNEMFFKCPIFICHIKKFGFKMLSFTEKKNIKKSRSLIFTHMPLLKGQNEIL